MHQIEQIETAVMVPAGFRAVHLPERAYAVDTCRPDALRHVEQTIRPKRYAASLQPLSIGTQRRQRVFDMVDRHDIDGTVQRRGQRIGHTDGRIIQHRPVSA